MAAHAVQSGVTPQFPQADAAGLEGRFLGPRGVSRWPGLGEYPDLLGWLDAKAALDWRNLEKEELRRELLREHALAAHTNGP